MREYKSISIKRGSVKTTYEEYNVENGDKHVIKYENKTQPHDDFVEAMEALLPFAERIIGFGLPDCTLTGYSIGMSGEERTIYLYLEKRPEEDRLSNSITVRTRCGMDCLTEWDRMAEQIRRIEQEMNLYMRQGKAYQLEGRMTEA